MKEAFKWPTTIRALEPRARRMGSGRRCGGAARLARPLHPPLMPIFNLSVRYLEYLKTCSSSYSQAATRHVHNGSRSSPDRPHQHRPSPPQKRSRPLPSILAHLSCPRRIVHCNTRLSLSFLCRRAHIPTEARYSYTIRPHRVLCPVQPGRRRSHNRNTRELHPTAVTR